MRRSIKGLCALFSLCLVVALTAPTQALTAPAQLSVTQSQLVEEETTLYLEEYIYQTYVGLYVRNSYRSLDTVVNRVSLDAILTFTALEDDVSIYVSTLTDLNGNDLYEWVNSDGASARDILTADNQLEAIYADTNPLSLGESRSLSAAQLFARSLAVEQSRLPSGSLPLSGLEVSSPADPIYCITVTTGSSSQSYYFMLDRSMDYTVSVSQLGAAVFYDVSPSAWYCEPVDWAVREGLLAGSTDVTFSPAAPVTRASLLQTLYAQAGRPSTSGSSFTDVATEAWYYQAVSWGSDLGLITGYADGTFQPDYAVTREQLALILYNALGPEGYTPSDSLSHYSDYSSLSPWAETAMSWAIETQILDEMEGSQLAPKTMVDRAALATVLWQLGQAE